MIHLPPLPRLLAHPLLLLLPTTSPLPPQILSIQFIPRKPRTARPPLTRRPHTHRPRPPSIPENATTSDILRRTAPPQTTRDLLVIHHHHHPHPDFLVAAHQRRAVDPPGFPFDVARSAAQPGNFGGDAGAVREGIKKAFTHVLWAADAVEEFGL